MFFEANMSAGRLFSHDYSRISKRVLFLLKNMLCFAWACAILFQDKTLREVQLGELQK